MRRLVLVGLVAVCLGAPATAEAAEQTLVFRSGPITLRPYFTAQGQAPVQSPELDGYVTGLEARIVDGNGRELDYRSVMLHHVVLVNVLRRDMTCGKFTTFDGTTLPRAPERFFGVGEEGQKLVLPPGYGYANKARDVWGMAYMLMNHRKRTLTAYVEYRVTYVTGRTLTPVRPIWIDGRNCIADPIWDVPGTGGPRSVHRRTATFDMPESGVLVAGGGHLHGGGIALTLQNRTCNTTVFESRPTYGRVEPKPLLHEAGPSRMSSFLSPLGIPVHKGDRLDLTAAYDNSMPHTRVMGIMVVFFAPRLTTPCAPPGPLQVDVGRPSAPPLVRFPLPVVPQDPARAVRSTWVGDYRFGARAVRIRPGQRFTWRFVGSDWHNVTLANGPVGFSSPNLLRGTFSYTFRRPGRYELLCALHPVAMSQVVTVAR